MSTIADLRAKWELRRSEHARLHSLVSMEAVCAEVLADLADVASSSDELVTLKEAHVLGGYAIDSLQRMVARGEIENVGRRGKPRLRRADVPVKPGHSLRPVDAADQLSPRRRIVRSALDHTQRSA